jgi:hypothetical protein
VPARTHIDSCIAWTEKQKTNVPTFFNLLDGAWEDLDRLDGHASEYADMSMRGLRIGEYGERLRVDEVPEGVRVVFMTDDEEFLEGQVEDEPVRRARVPGPR